MSPLLLCSRILVSQELGPSLAECSDSVPEDSGQSVGQGPESRVKVQLRKNQLLISLTCHDRRDSVPRACWLKATSISCHAGSAEGSSKHDSWLIRVGERKRGEKGR